MFLYSLNHLYKRKILNIKNYILKFILIIILLFLLIKIKKNRKKIGVVSLSHGYNIGNNLLKYAISIKLKELGFEPYIIGLYTNNRNISFLNKTTNIRIIKNNFNEIKKNDYDILMVNSDQTWRKKNTSNKHFYDIGFLKFSKNWKIKKFVYGASLGIDYWIYTKKDEEIAKECLKNFTGISVREIGSIKLIQKHLGIKPTFVLDPTLLIDKKYYLDIIKNYKGSKNFNNNCIFTYIFLNEANTRKFINIASKELGYTIYNVNKKEKDSIYKFIYGILNCKAVITNSFHGTIFSIIFNKPFVSFIFKNSPKERLKSLGKIFDIKNRIFDYNKFPNINLLKIPPKINPTLIYSLRIKSIKFLKDSLGI